MSRWIEVEQLIDISIPVLCGGGNEEMAVLVEDINSAPSIDIVRCRECKYAEFCEKKIHRHGMAYSIDFCSYGEAKESE